MKKKEEIRICTAAVKETCKVVFCVGITPHLCTAHLQWWNCGFNRTGKKVRCIKVKE